MRQTKRQYYLDFSVRASEIINDNGKTKLRTPVLPVRQCIEIKICII